MDDKRRKWFEDLISLFRVKPGSSVVLERDFDPSFKAGVRKKDGVALPAERGTGARGATAREHRSRHGSSRREPPGRERPVCEPPAGQLTDAGPITVNEAPWGSIRAAKRPNGMSIGSCTIVAPRPRALVSVVSQSATAKHTAQCGGTSGGK